MRDRIPCRGPLLLAGGDLGVLQIQFLDPPKVLDVFLVRERIATFDNDGTLWVEQPTPVQAPFLLEKLVDKVRAYPSLADEEPYSRIINRDREFFEGLARQVPETVLSFLNEVVLASVFLFSVDSLAAAGPRSLLLLPVLPLRGWFLPYRPCPWAGPICRTCR